MFRRRTIDSERSKLRRRLWRAIGIEALENRLLLTADFGDADFPYPVTLADDGARHADVGPMLGQFRDTEDDGVNSRNAVDDDRAGDLDGNGDLVNDEDGVAFQNIVIGDTVSAFVEVTGDNAVLDAWIDFNRDGIWEPSEKIFDSIAVTNGTNELTYDVPADASLGKIIRAIPAEYFGDRFADGRSNRW